MERVTGIGGVFFRSLDPHRTQRWYVEHLGLPDPIDGDPAVVRDLQRTCLLCDHKSRCRRELAEGSAAQHFRDFCPNAYTFDALFKQSGIAPH